MSKYKLVSFDLDETLIRGVDSVKIPCILSGKEKEHCIIQEKEDAGIIDYISADYLRAKLLKGLKESKIADSFLEIANPINGIKRVVDTLHKAGILCIIITLGPKQVAKVAGDIWGFDGYYGSDYEVLGGVFTGKIREYVSVENKIKCLKDFCGKYGITREECIAVGDGLTDIPLFKYCGKAIAINALPAAKAIAGHAVDTNDLTDILRYITTNVDLAAASS